MDRNNSADFLDLIKRISDQLDPEDNFVNAEYIAKLQSRYHNIVGSIDEIMDTAREMKIGIVGEVKAGKSSFLNAIIFNGESILPQAATPMTAALTKLTYSKDNIAKVVFYTDYDWRQIESLSGRYDDEFSRLYNEYLLEQGPISESKNMLQTLRDEFIPKTSSVDLQYDPQIPEYIRHSIDSKISNEYKACKELTTMVLKRQLNIGALLNTTEEFNLSDIKKDLEKFVGADGEFTPLVKHIELRLDNELLNGFEIIDTPGLNDPILSRSDTTKKYLMNCDLVFLLSYSGQFLNNEDINFIGTTLPSESIQHAVLIGSKFDSAVLDYPTKRGQSIPFINALRSTQNTLNQQAESSIRDCKKSNAFKGATVLDKLSASMPPYYISSLIYNAAKKLSAGQQLLESEELVLNNLKSRFSGFDTSIDFLFELSNIEPVKKRSFDMIHKEKRQIIEERSRTLIRTEIGNFLSLLEDINIQAMQNLTDINIYDKEKLEEKINTLSTKMNSMRGQVKTIFEGCAVESQKYIADISVDVKCIVKNHTDIQTQQKQEVHHGSYQEGWWIFKSTRHYTETVTIHVASVHDVISNIREYIIEAEKMINSDIGKAININGVKKKVKDCILQAFDLSDTSFNENDILGPLELVMQKLVVPKINIDTEGFNEMILEAFSSTFVEGSQIHNLMLKQEVVLQKVTKEICKRLADMSKEIEGTLIEKASTFVDDVNKQLAVNIEVLQKHLKNKEESIASYDRFLQDIKLYKEQLRALGGL